MTAAYRPPADGDLAAVVDAVRAALTDDLRRPPWRGSDRPTAGHCYVASEALFHLLGGRPRCQPMHLKHEGAPHTFLLLAGGEVVDPTEDQFNSPVPHGAARRSNFLPPTPSARARVVIARVRGVAGPPLRVPAQGVLDLP